MNDQTLKVFRICEDLYAHYQYPEFIDPDPLMLVKQVDPQYREGWALVMATLALGRVAQILRIGTILLETCGQEGIHDPGRIEKLVPHIQNLKHRFFNGSDLSHLLLGISKVIVENGSLEAVVARGIIDSKNQSGSKCFLALGTLRKELIRTGGPSRNNLLSQVPGTSANKRWAMFLRWVVRKDAIDIGTWTCLTAKDLIMPIDTHILRNCRILGITNRNVADNKTAEEITRFFAVLCPEDPLKYDFVLSRVGIHPALKNISLEKALSSV